MNLSQHENLEFLRKREALSTIIVEKVSLKDVTIKDAVLWLSKETKCDMSLMLGHEVSVAPDVDPFAEGKQPKMSTFSVELNHANIFEILEVFCEKSNYYWRFSNSLFLVAPKQYFVEK